MMADTRNEDIPDVTEGDEVEVSYTAKTTGERTTRTGVVIDTWDTGFRFRAERQTDDESTKVTSAKYPGGGDYVRLTSSRKDDQTDQHDWRHLSELNHRDAVDIEVTA